MKTTIDERFPYPELLRLRVRDDLPPEAWKFYDTVWAPNSETEPFHHRTTVFTFEFWKVLLASIDPGAAKEAYFLAVSVRLAAHMCYALVICMALLFGTTIVCWFEPDLHRLWAVAALLTSVETGAVDLPVHE